MLYEKLKKAVAVLMCVAMCAGVTACGGNSGEKISDGTAAKGETKAAEDSVSKGDLSNTLVYDRRPGRKLRV